MGMLLDLTGSRTILARLAWPVTGCTAYFPFLADAWLLVQPTYFIEEANRVRDLDRSIRLPYVASIVYIS